MIIPKLCNYKKPLTLEQVPDATAFSAGHLVSKNASWRIERPVINREKCVGCFKCYMYCPDGAVRKDAVGTSGARQKVFVDYDFCKGCGICVKECRLNAITMEAEKNE